MCDFCGGKYVRFWITAHATAHTKINRPRKHPIWRRFSIYLLCKPSSNPLSQILLPWQWGSLGEKFAWHHSMAYLRKPLYWRENLADISYTDQVIVNFFPNFVAMATGVTSGKILMNPSDSPGPKIGGRCKQCAIIFYCDLAKTILFQNLLPWQWGSSRAIG